MLTPEDLQQFAGLLDTKLSQSEARTAEAIHTAVAAAEARMTETIRDTETNILNQMFQLSRNYAPRLHRLETSDADMQEQLAGLHNRLLRVEERLGGTLSNPKQP